MKELLRLTKVKRYGKVYTPDYLVNIILDKGHYINGNINKKHVIDNSCGDGQFLTYIVDRYCKDYLINNNDLIELKKQLETFIHGIEIDNDELEICRHRCDDIVKKYGLNKVLWNFVNDDSMKINIYDSKMDFVIGNPPYVRIHNLIKEPNLIKNYLFSNKGMTDLYIIFYEIGIKMLNKNGILCYITPSSFFTSLAGLNMRLFLSEYKLIESVCDLKHFQAFNATVYTTIICLNKSKKNECVEYYEFDEKKLKPYFIEKISHNDYFIKNNYYFGPKQKLIFLKKVLLSNKTTNILVKNGYATLSDKIFINDFDFESKFIIPVIKASKGELKKIFYPYDKENFLIDELVLKKDLKMYNYLKFNKNNLLKKNHDISSKNCWYAFGRSQGIKDTYKDKIAINSLIKTTSDLKIVNAPIGTGVYSGLYVVSDKKHFPKIKKALNDNEFGLYISLLGKYKNGGYYTFSSKDVKKYLDYKLKNEEI
ncbi:Eco57I restriction-modification methylase domain-containing protein [Ureaplasma parvum]|uniref:Eco57I restriction-modification methylase domain-containing protein n=1 Tax=Ureaplasma parvum TaxID=134821 RepID=UPI001F3460FF|nr:Eco57I restriction-modification methylase domain-containing protein [Ureaplasma parvum]UIU28591.1 Eco57I restriction-modification methylase domain-containing protein [Ureaplasma parvum]